MLMSHRLTLTRVWLEYTVTMETSKRLTPVRPLWLRANGCESAFELHRRRRRARGSTDDRSAVVADADQRADRRRRRAPARQREGPDRQPAGCGDRTIIDHRPRWGWPADAVYRIRPVCTSRGRSR